MTDVLFNYLNDDSKKKNPFYNPVFIEKPVINYDIFLKNFVKCVKYPINMEKINSNIEDIKNIMDYFNSTFNKNSSKFNDDLKTMNKTLSFKLFLDSTSSINIYFIYKKYEKIIPVLIHAINSFCHFFKNKKNYDGLNIYVSLDDNKRSLDMNISIDDHIDKCTAFTVSGITNKANKLIILTKKEEIIKLLFHELIHYTELDLIFVGDDVINNTSSGPWNVSECYAETLGIIFYSLFQSIYLSSEIKLSIEKIFEKILFSEINYSIKLSSTVFKLMGVTDKNKLNKYFENKLSVTSFPISLVEYILLRTMLFLDYKTIQKIIDNNFNPIKIKQDIKTVFFSNKKFIEYMNNSFEEPVLDNLSYCSISVDWNKFFP